MIRALVRMEGLKLSRSLGSWTAFLAFGAGWGLAAQQIAREVVRAPNRSFDMGSAIPLLAGNLGVLSLIFTATVAVYLTSSEYASGTARYAVIRGLGRGEFLIGKFLQMTLLAMSVWLLTALLMTGAGVVFAERPSSSPGLPVTAWVLAAYAIALIEYGALGVMAGALIRKSGIAPVVVLAYLLLGETAIADGLAAVGAGGTREWLPAGAGTALLDYVTQPESRSDALPAAAAVISYTLAAIAFSVQTARKKDM